jgi:hypothetical protein
MRIDVIPRVYRSRLPRAKDVAAFAAEGGKSVVDLTQRPRPRVERACVRHGVEYHKHPLPHEGGDIASAAAFVLACARPVLFHCFHGRDRTGAVAVEIKRQTRPVAAVALINEKNDRTFTRVYRLAAFFAVPRLFAVDCPAQMRGNVYSARGQVEIVRCSISEYSELARGARFVVCDPFRGESTLRASAGLTVLCNCNRRGTPDWILSAAHATFHVPALGASPELCTDQAVAIALYALTSPSC